MPDRSRLSHKWITEEFYKVLDVYGFRATMFVEWGFRPADVKRTTERIKVPGAVVKEWARTAAQEEGRSIVPENGESRPPAAVREGGSAPCESFSARLEKIHIAKRARVLGR